MHFSVQTLVLTLTTLAVGGAEGFKFEKRADGVNSTSTQGAQNLLITNADQNLFYTPMQFGSGNGVVNIFGLVSTTRGDIILPGAYAKNLTGFISQGKSVAEGPIYSGPVSAAGWTVPDQDIVYYQNAGAGLPIPPGGEYAYAGFGIWPNTSTIYEAVGDWSADSLVARILAEPEAGLYWTLLISPSEDDRGTDQSLGGVLTIGEIANVSQIFNVSEVTLTQVNFPDLSLVAEYPFLNNSGVYNGTSYYILVDSISWGNGSATLKSAVPGTPSGKISAYLDSTYPWIQVPYSITEELYKGLEGATYANDTGLWHFKCTELSINVTIASHPYPITPLTAVQHVDSLNCVGTFQAKPANAGGDVILGVPFLKNVYARFSYQTRSNNQVYDPHVQLLSITDVVQAHNDWEAWYNKWGGSSPHPSSGDPVVHPTPTPTPSTHPAPPPSSSSLSKTSPASDPLATDTSGKVAGAVEDDGDLSLKSTKKKGIAKKLLLAIIIAVAVAGLVIIGCIVCIVMKLRKGRDGKGAYRGLAKPDDEIGPVKVPVYDAVGGSGHYGDGGSGNYGEGGQGRYTDPYKD